MRFKSTLTIVALALLIAGGLCAAANNVSGRVRDVDGRPLKGVTIAAAETSLKAFSDDRGEFTIALPASSRPLRLVFECPGYYAETHTLGTQELGASLDVILTPKRMLKQEVTVVASRLDISYLTNPAATSIVSPQTLDSMPKAIGAEEALMMVPGVKVDNQADGERVHLSIRGQGILSERGIRGIQVLYDGIPLNDPSGFCPDLFDVDWAGVQEVNVVRGPVAFLYGGGSAGGVIDIRTATSQYGPQHGNVQAAGGSFGFYKTRAETSGTAKGIHYLLSGSRTAGDGYRQHTAYWGDNGYGRVSGNLTSRLRLDAYLMGTGFFNQNAEGLNLAWIQQSGYRIPNPDALTFNEYQRTLRLTTGFAGQWQASDNQHLSFSFYTRRVGYKEPVPSFVDHRSIVAPGGSLQYEAEGKFGRVTQHFSTGLDLDGQYITDYKHPNTGNANEGSAFLANQDITQKRVGWFATERLSLGPRWTVLLGLRADRITNALTDYLKFGGLDLSGGVTFNKVTGRAGVTYNATKQIGLYASWGQGFLPPATEELYANPAAPGGFNKSLVPATSNGGEGGIRGNIRNRFFYDADVFHLSTTNDFERYRITTRPLETFYGNAGKTSRWGLETSARWLPVSRLTLSGAYTASHFVYTEYNSLTYPGNLVGKYLPNSPVHQLSLDAVLEFARGSMLEFGALALSRQYVDPSNKPYVDGYALLNARIAKIWQRGSRNVTAFIAGRNLTGRMYIAFAEPDPDGNSYHPGQGRELFTGLQLRF
jgi:iron complex outermembrane receptor protein